MVQTLLTTPLVLWAAWYVFGSLAPWQRRRSLAWMARRLDGHAPAWIPALLRPGMPKTGCGCGTACHEPGRLTDTRQR